jgi:hypothetical protein
MVCRDFGWGIEAPYGLFLASYRSSNFGLYDEGYKIQAFVKPVYPSTTAMKIIGVRRFLNVFQ